MTETATVIKFIPFDKTTKIMSIDTFMTEDKIKMVLYHPNDGKVSLAIGNFKNGHVTAIDVDSDVREFESKYHPLFLNSTVKVISAKNWSELSPSKLIQTFECLDDNSGLPTQTIRGKLLKSTDITSSKKDKESKKDETKEISAQTASLWMDKLTQRGEQEDKEDADESQDNIKNTEENEDDDL